jgi:hypothetical protein
LNSCTPELHDIVIGKMAFFSDPHKVGPVSFMVLMRQLTNVSAEAVRIITNKLATLSLADFEWESFSLANNAIHCTYKCWLQMLNHTPHDMEVIFMQIYKTTSIPSFKHRLEAICTSHMSYNTTTGYTCSINAETLMDICAQFYEESILEGSWDRSADSSSFKARSIPSKFLPPREGESESKDINGKLYKYCRICRHWISGTKMHATKHHVARDSGLPPPIPASDSSAHHHHPVYLAMKCSVRLTSLVVCDGGAEM